MFTGFELFLVTASSCFCRAFIAIRFSRPSSSRSSSHAVVLFSAACAAASFQYAASATSAHSYFFPWFLVSPIGCRAGFFLQFQIRPVGSTTPNALANPLFGSSLVSTAYSCKFFPLFLVSELFLFTASSCFCRAFIAVPF